MPHIFNGMRIQLHGTVQILKTNIHFFIIVFLRYI